jgi:pimeloyl-ACP methyl ester carboxylesterase
MISGEERPARRARRLRTPPLAALRLALGGLGRISSSAAAAVAMRIFMTPPRYVPSQREAATLRSATPVAIPFEGSELQGWSWGEGPPVLLVHGWGGRASQMTAFVPPLIERGFRVIAFDGPAHGHSAGRRSSLMAFVRAVMTCGDLFGPFEAIIAHSMGTAATIMALERGVKSACVVLFGPTARPGEYIHHFTSVIGLSEKAAKLMQSRLGARYNLRWEDVDMPRIATALQLPAIVFHDKDDTDAAWKDGNEIAAAWPGAELVTTSGLGHRRILRDPAIVAQAVQWVETKMKANG